MQFGQLTERGEEISVMNILPFFFFLPIINCLGVDKDAVVDVQFIPYPMYVIHY